MPLSTELAAPGQDPDSSRRKTIPMGAFKELGRAFVFKALACFDTPPRPPQVSGTPGEFRAIAKHVTDEA